MSHHDTEAVLHPVALASLRPTQMAVGLREVQRKRERWCELDADARERFLSHHMLPTVIGPKGRRYLVDHHHLCRALHDEKADWVFAMTLADLSHLGHKMFWTVMEHRGWIYPFDHKGERCSVDDLPRSIGQLDDDPFRSLAAELRAAGGYAKEPTPIHEFLWAAYLRSEIGGKRLLANRDLALAAALDLAHAPQSSFMPGWCGLEL
jgi:hypothetical protein